MEGTEKSEGRKPGDIENLGEPVNLTNLNLAGVSAHAARGGEKVDIWTRMALTSDEALFHQIIGGLVSALERAARGAGVPTSLARADTVLLIIKPDNSAELWVDSAAVCVFSTLKRPGLIPAGSVLFEHDIADVTGMWFPKVNVEATDRVLCIFREGWRFGLYFDFNPDGNLQIEVARRALGGLYRKMRYADVYSALAQEPVFDALLAAGWFPFLELVSGEFQSLIPGQQSKFDLDAAEEALLAKFDDGRIDRMFARWMSRPHLKAKEAILQPAVAAFKAKEPVLVIKTVLTEIEGVLADGYYLVKGERTNRIKRLLDFAITQAEQRAGGQDTLFFPSEFGRYLKDYTFAGFTPGSEAGAGSRNAVGHGAAGSDQYTMTRALQALLTLDQVAFYT